MKYFTSPLFRRLYNKLDFQKKEAVKEAISFLTDFYASGVKLEGLGLKQLQPGMWEIRSSLKDRVLFTLEKNEVLFLMVGNHDDIRRYLKNS